MSYLSSNRAKVISLWEQKVSYEEIARILGHGVTKNAVSGFCYRSGLKRRVIGGEPIPRKKKRQFSSVKPPKKVFKRAAFVSVEQENIPVEQRKSILELKSNTCRWPVGNPKTGNFFYCGGDTAKNSVYCEFHSRRAYRQPPAIKPTLNWAVHKPKFQRA